FPAFLRSLDTFPDCSFRFAFVNDQLVPVRVTELCHPTNWRLGFLDIKGDAAIFELRDGSIDVINFESDCRSIPRGFPRGMTTNSDRDGSKIILDPCANTASQMAQRRNARVDPLNA